MENIIYGLYLVNLAIYSYQLFTAKNICRSLTESGLTSSLSKMISTIFMISILAPICEETFFRLWLKQLLADIPYSYYRLISSTIFAIVHGNNGLQLGLDSSYYHFYAFHIYNAFILGYIFSGFDNFNHAVLAHICQNSLIVLLVCIKTRMETLEMRRETMEYCKGNNCFAQPISWKKNEILCLKSGDTGIFASTWRYPTTNIVKLKRSHSFSNIHGNKIYRDEELNDKFQNRLSRKFFPLSDEEMEKDEIDNVGDEEEFGEIDEIDSDGYNEKKIL